MIAERYPPYPRYKPSGVAWLGEIPSHWEVRRLKFVASQVPVRLDQKPADMAYLGLENVESGTGKLLLESPTEIVDSVVNVFKQGDVLFGKLRPYLAKVVHAKFDGVCTGELMVLRPHHHYLDARFLFYLMLSHGFISIVDSMTYGAKMPRANPNHICNLEISLPPLAEQRAIAAYLDRETARIDTLMAHKRDLLALLERRRAALISHAVTKGLNPDAPLKPSGVAWLGEIPSHWEVWKVAHIFRHIGSGTTPPTNLQEFYDGTINWVNTSELRDSVILQTQKRVTEAAVKEFSALQIYPPDTLLIALYGATIGKIGLLGIEATTNQACCALVHPRNLLPKFGFYSLFASRDWLISMAYGGGQPNISQGVVKALKLPIPPLAEQEAIIYSLDRETARIDRLKAEIETSLDLLARYRVALISAAVTGKIDVRGLAQDGAPALAPADQVSCQ